MDLFYSYVCSVAYIFMFFSMVLGLNPQSREDSFGFEFVDIWKNILSQQFFHVLKKCFL